MLLLSVEYLVLGAAGDVQASSRVRLARKPLCLGEGLRAHSQVKRVPEHISS